MEVLTRPELSLDESAQLRRKEAMVGLRLINALSSPYGRKVAIALKEKAITFEVTYDVPWRDDTCVVQYSPLEQLPILILDNGTTVYDSSFILEWLEVRYPKPPLLSSNAEEALATRFLKLLGERVMEAIHALVFELQRPEPSQPFVERQARKVRRGLAEIEAALDRRHPVQGMDIDIGDIAVGSMLLLIPFLIENRFVADLEVLRWRSRHDRLAAYADRLAERRSFQETKPALMDIDLKSVVA
jgi:glutathione S-transferase